MGPQAAGECFHSFFEFSETFTGVSIIDRNVENMFSISFRKHCDEEKENHLSTLSNCEFSLLTPSPQQLVLVLCLHRVIETLFLTNQCACFLNYRFHKWPAMRMILSAWFGHHEKSFSHKGLLQLFSCVEL